MKNIILLFLFTLMLIGCDKAHNSESNTTQDSDVFQINANTKYITINTTDSEENLKLVNALEQKLKKDGFSFEKMERSGGSSFNHCAENAVVEIIGKGVSAYYAKSSKPNKNTQFYPDFVVNIYEFSDKNEADEKFSIIQKAYHSRAGYFCNGKQPGKLVSQGNAVYYFSTRAEMFSTEIEKYGKFIENFRP
jgi:hypothetical protein